jgi:hypothetical protein
LAAVKARSGKGAFGDPSLRQRHQPAFGRWARGDFEPHVTRLDLLGKCSPLTACAAPVANGGDAVTQGNRPAAVQAWQGAAGGNTLPL